MNAFKTWFADREVRDEHRNSSRDEAFLVEDVFDPSDAAQVFVQLCFEKGEPIKKHNIVAVCEDGGGDAQLFVVTVAMPSSSDYTAEAAPQLTWMLAK